MNALELLNRIGTVGDQSDAQLLARFLDFGDAGSQAALTALVERHGPLVFRVCRQVLGNSQDAEDAFQATFLVLARKANSIRNVDSVASWLHGVAVRVSRRSKSEALRRRSHESRAAIASETAVEENGVESWPELHEEVARLPNRYREAVVLCYLEGLSTEAAAQRIGCPRGTVLSRLSRARDRLRERLTRRGLAVPSAFLPEGVNRTLPASLVASAVRASLIFSGRFSSKLVVSASVMTLTKETLYAMMISKAKLVCAGVLLLGLGGLGLRALVPAKGGVEVETHPVSAVEPEASLVQKEVKAGEALFAQPDPNKNLAEARFNLLEHALVEFEEARNAPPGLEVNKLMFALWNRRLLEASRGAGVEKVKIVALLEAYLKHAKKNLEGAQLDQEKGSGSRIDVLNAEYSVLETEMRLNEMKAR